MGIRSYVTLKEGLHNDHMESDLQTQSKHRLSQPVLKPAMRAET
jgi:hypothetical protein